MTRLQTGSGEGKPSTGERETEPVGAMDRIVSAIEQGALSGDPNSFNLKPAVVGLVGRIFESGKYPTEIYDGQPVGSSFTLEGADGKPSISVSVSRDSLDRGHVGWGITIGEGKPGEGEYRQVYLTADSTAEEPSASVSVYNNNERIEEIVTRLNGDTLLALEDVLGLPLL